MRVQCQLTSLSWIPSEAVAGAMKATFATGLSHYDPPPPASLPPGGLDELRKDDAFRFANHLTAWAEFDGDELVGFEQGGGAIMGATTVRVGKLDATFAGVLMPDLRPEPTVEPGRVTVTQTVGGRTALPLPRRISKPPYVRMQAPLVWTTLRLTLQADGTATGELSGASPFPRHWVYDASGAIAAKAGVADWKQWLGQQSRENTPWGEEDSPVVVAAAESALERELSAVLMHNAARPRIRRIGAGAILAKQGEPGHSLFLILDGVLDVSVDGRQLGELGPGAVVGEHAILQASPRTATLTARTAVRVAEAPADTIDRDALAALAAGHRREHDRASTRG